MNYPLQGYPRKGQGFGKDLGKTVTDVVGLSRDNDRYKVEKAQQGLKMEQVDAASADLGRAQETAQYDKDYELYKRDMQRGIREFAMDSANYQDAIDTANEFYGSNMQVTHRKDPASGQITYDFSGVDKNGNPIESYGKTREELGAMLNMSMNPTTWLEKYEQTNIDRKVAAASAQHDIDKIDAKGEWDLIIESIKQKTKGADRSLKYQDATYKRAKEAFGSLRDEGLISFGEGHDDEYASLTAAYSAHLAEYAPGFEGDVNASHAHALKVVRDEIEMVTKQLRAQHGEEADDDMIDQLAADLVSDKLQVLSQDIKTSGAASKAPQGEVDAAVKDNPDKYRAALEKAGRTEPEIQQAFKEANMYYEPKAGAQKGQAGLNKPAPSDQRDKKGGVSVTLPDEGSAMPDQVETPGIDEDIAALGLDEEKTAQKTEAEPAEKMESAAQKGEVELLDQPVDFGSVEKKARKARVSQSGQKLDNEIKAARKGNAYNVPGTGERKYKGTEKLKKLRKEAARRVTAAFKGQGKIKSRVVLEAALNSGELEKSVEDAVRKELG